MNQNNSSKIIGLVMTAALVTGLSACGSSSKNAAPPVTPSTSTIPAAVVVTASAPVAMATTTSTVLATKPVTAAKVGLSSSSLASTGIAGIKVGATVAQASKASGLKLTVDKPAESDMNICSATIAGMPGVTLFIEPNQTIDAVYLMTPSVKTTAGLHLGSTVSDLKRLYPSATLTDRVNDIGYVIKGSNGTELLVDTDGSSVTGIFAGKDGIEKVEEFCG